MAAGTIIRPESASSHSPQDWSSSSRRRGRSTVSAAAQRSGGRPGARRAVRPAADRPNRPTTANVAPWKNGGYTRSGPQGSQPGPGARAPRGHNGRGGALNHRRQVRARLTRAAQLAAKRLRSRVDRGAPTGYEMQLTRTRAAEAHRIADHNVLQQDARWRLPVCAGGGQGADRQIELHHGGEERRPGYDMVEKEGIRARIDLDLQFCSSTMFFRESRPTSHLPVLIAEIVRPER